ncbi:hypothetical protein [Methylobacterium sp. PvR107]|uniref:hypothetical protein n=1 Tax=Methylobacterium sp. PvR107 TaxID=2806597 RepID=UPI001AE83B64|nr:hypothetical protein [Methylobacterium sp. PvR107]MBP1180233.1 hypothetical protein [Methylobacterium sp. PvR107]
MGTPFAAAVFFGSTVGALAVEPYTNFRDYFDATPAFAVPVARSNAKTTYGVDTGRHDAGRDAKTAANLKPGYRNQAGGYVPPDYTTHPRVASQNDFRRPSAMSSGSSGAPKAFTGALGTRR